MKTKLFHRLPYAVGVALFLLFVFAPITWTFVISITPEYEMLKNTPHFLPSQLYWGNYKTLFNFNNNESKVLLGGLLNSLKISFYTIIIGLPSATMAAYAFARFRSKALKWVVMFIMLTIVIPVFTTIVPIYSAFSDLGLLDNLFFVAIIYVSSFLPLNTWIILNYFKQLPAELWESAKVDGCNETQSFFSIILPNAYPILLTCALMMFISSWSQFQIPLILLTTPKNRVITMVLSTFMTRNDISYGMIALSGLLATLVPAFITVIFRNCLVEGLTQGSVKG